MLYTQTTLSQTTHAQRWFVAAKVLLGLGGVLILMALARHESSGGAFFGRYSLAYGLLLAAGAVGLLAYALAMWRWPRAGAGRLAWALQRLPVTLLDPLIILAIAALSVWVFHPFGGWAFLHDPVLRAGVLCGALALVAVMAALADQTPERQSPQLIMLAMLAFALEWAYLQQGRLAQVAVGVVSLGVIYALLAWRRPIGGLGEVLSGFKTWLVAHPWAVGGLGVAAVVVWVIWIYGLSIPGQQLHDDDLMYVQFVYQHGPFDGFVLPINDHFVAYRPLVTLQTWLEYQWFSLDISAWRVVHVALLAGAAASLFWVFWRAGRHAVLAVGLTVLIVASAAMNELLIWTVESAPLRTLLMGLALVGLVTVRPLRSGHTLVLLGLVALILFTNEVGLAFTVALCLYTLYAAWQRLIDGRQAAALIVGSAVFIGVYILVRRSVITHSLAETLSNNGVIFFTAYSGPDVVAMPLLQRVLVHVYVVTAHLLGTFFPIYLTTGALWPAAIAAALIVVALTVLLVYRPRAGDSAGRYVLRAIGLAAVAILVAAIQLPETSIPPAIQFGLTAGVSLSLLIGLTRTCAWSPERRGWLVMGAALIVCFSGIGLAYYRHRIGLLGVIGWAWLLLAALAPPETPAAAEIKRPPDRSRWRTATLTLCLLLVAISGHSVYTQSEVTPVLIPIMDGGVLCQPDYPEALAYQAVDAFGIERATLEQCRAELAATNP